MKPRLIIHEKDIKKKANEIAKALSWGDDTLEKETRQNAVYVLQTLFHLEKIKKHKPFNGKNLNSFVYDYPAKYYMGFMSEEIDYLVNEVKKQTPDFNLKKYNDAMMGHTCPSIDGRILFYRGDVYRAILCGMENRNLKVSEWD